MVNVCLFSLCPGDDLNVLVSLLQGIANLFLEGRDKTVSLTGLQESTWSDTVIFRGDSVTCRFCAEEDGNIGQSGLLGDDQALHDWGFRLTVSLTVMDVDNDCD